MPTYTFECEKCGRYEISLRPSECQLTACPHCQSSIRRIFKPNPNFYKMNADWGKEKHQKLMDMDDLDDPSFKWSKLNQQDMMDSYKERRWGTRNPDPEQVIAECSSEPWE